MSHSHQSIKFCPYCGEQVILRQVYNEQHAACPACGWVHYEDPKVAVAVVLLDGSRILLTRRVFNPSQGDWTLPAGFMNAYEHPEAAAQRECREETGLEVAIDSLVDIISGREHARGADIVIVYRAHTVGGKLQAGDDAAEVAYFELSQLPALAFQATRQVVAMLQKENQISGSPS